jgi:hypothetical protein
MSEPRTMDMVFWITERYAILQRRVAGQAPPWTADPVMASVRFCNVHREDDKVTKWMRENWSTKDSPAWWFVLGRMLNYIPTLEDIVEYGVCGDDGDRGVDDLPELDGLRDGLKDVRESGKKVFTSAYTISTCGKSMDKIDYVVDWVCERVKTAEEQKVNWPRYRTLKDTWGDLTMIDGLGSFLAAQVVADMKNTGGHPLENASDWWDWCAPGPGSLKGLKAFFGVSVTTTTFHGYFKECRRLVDPLIPHYIPRISAQDFQNCLCEFSKYARVREGGHARNRYAASV